MSDETAAPAAPTPTLETRVTALEAAIQKLPHSIATVMQQGSLEVEDFAKAVLAHLFG